ncbi:MAG: Cro/CI family transcriptional regulator [Pseudomonadota bacterium]
MDKDDVIEHFGSAAEVARQLDISRAAVSAWGDVVPEMSALRLEKLTDGALVYDESAYRGDAA